MFVLSKNVTVERYENPNLKENKINKQKIELNITLSHQIHCEARTDLKIKIAIIVKYIAFRHLSNDFTLTVI